MYQLYLNEYGLPVLGRALILHANYLGLCAYILKCPGFFFTLRINGLTDHMNRSFQPLIPGPLDLLPVLQHCRSTDGSHLF